MKKFFLSLVLVVSLLAIMGCSNGVGGTGSNVPGGTGPIIDNQDSGTEKVPFVSLEESIKKLGTVSKIYTAETSPARFSNGDIIPQSKFGMELYCEGLLVEYSELNNKISDYYKYIEDNNLIFEHNKAGLSQHYIEMIYSEGKTYIEFNCYKVYDKNKKPEEMSTNFIETRKYSGDFIKGVVEKQDYSLQDNFALSINFDPSMEIDIQKNWYINNLGTPSTVGLYECPYETKSLSNINDYENYNIMSKVGKISNIYRNYYSGVPSDIYLIEYKKDGDLKLSNILTEDKMKDANIAFVPYEINYDTDNYSYIQVYNEKIDEQTYKQVNDFFISDRKNGNSWMDFRTYKLTAQDLQ